MGSALTTSIPTWLSLISLFEIMGLEANPTLIPAPVLFSILFPSMEALQSPPYNSIPIRPFWMILLFIMKTLCLVFPMIYTPPNKWLCILESFIII